MRKLLAVLFALSLLLTLTLCVSAASDSSAASDASESSSASDSVSDGESAASAQSAEASAESSSGPKLYTYEEAFAEMTVTDYIVLIGGFLGSMLLAMVVYAAILKRKHKKNVDKYRRP